MSACFRIRAFLATVLLCLLALATARPGAAADLSVAVTIPPQAWFVERLAGDLAEITVLVPPGADPHTYEPKPSQVAGLARADLWLTIGVEFEHAWRDRLLGANPDLVLAAMDQGIEKRPMAAHEHHGEEHHDDEHHGDEHHGDEHEGLDPHVWTAPPLALILADNTAAALMDADPSHQAVYRANLAALRADIETLHAELAALFSALDQDKKRFLVYHPSWGYFADAYGLEQLVIEAEGKDPGARELMALIDYAEAHKVSTVFVQPQFSDKSARVVAEAIGGNVVRADPLARDWDANLRKVARAFNQAMERE